jgi:hypothetical protein
MTAKKSRKKSFKLPKIRLRLITWLFLFIAAVTLPTLIKKTFFPTQIEAGWWDDGWIHRKRIPLSNDTTEETDVYIEITGYDASDTVKHQADCGDMRFTKENGELLPYYVSSCGASTTIHINFNTLPAGDQNIYLYYGNSRATNGFETSDFSTEATSYTVGTIASEEITPGPVAFWKFDEGVDNTCSAIDDVCDNSGHGNDGVITDATWQTEDMCVSGKCLSFDGVNDGIVLDFDSSQGSYSALTVSTWVRLGDKEGKQVILNEQGINSIWLNFDTSGNDKVNFYLGDTTNVGYHDSNTTLSRNEWHLITLTYDDSSNEAKLYIDAVLDSTITTSGTVNLDASMTIGKRESPTNYFDGRIDQMKIYRYARSADEIKQDYTVYDAPQGGGAILGTQDQVFMSNGLIGYWDMDEASTPSIDYAGRGFDATWNGDAASGTGKFSGGITQADGGAGYLSVSDTGDPFDMGTSNFSVAMWFKLDSLSSPDAPELLDKMLVATTGYHLRVGYNDEIELQIKGTNGDVEVNSADSVITTDTWYHVVAVYDNENGHKIYINGQQSGSTQSGDAGNIDNTDTLRIGIGFNSWELDGTYDEVRIFNKALNSQEATDLYNWLPDTILTNFTLPNPIAHWSFDEQQGQTSNDSISSNDGTRGADTGSSTDDPTWKTDSSCKLNGCLSFDGSDYINLGDIAGYKIVDKTISFWANPTGSISGTSPIISNGGGNWYAGFASTNRMITSHSKTDTTQQTTYSGDNEAISDAWHHYSYSFSTVGSDVTVKMYVDAELVTTTSYDTGYGTNYGTNFVLGTFSSGALFFTGLIDEVKIYNSALSLGQIKRDMNSGSVLSYSTTVNERDNITDGAGNPSTGYWSFDENTGTSTTYDKGSDQLDGTLNGSMTENDWVRGKYGSALEFDGTDDYIEVDPTWLAESTNYTVMLWFYPNGSTSTDSLFARGSAGGCFYNPSISVNEASDIISFKESGCSGSGNLTNQSYPYTNDWIHLAMTRNGETVKGYINGQLMITDTSQPNPTFQSDGRLLLGAISQNVSTEVSHTSSMLDEVKVYDYDLTQAQIAYDYNRGKPLAHWKFDECEGSTINDSSGNGNSGTLTIGATGTQASIGTCNTSSTAWGNGSSGKYGSSLNFDGTDDNLLINDNDKLDGFTQMSTFFWAKHTASATKEMVVKHLSATSDVNWEVFQSGLNIAGRVVGTNVTCTTTGSAFSADVWHHVGMTWDGTNVKMYIDGELMNTCADSDTMTNSIGNLSIGSYEDLQYPFSGQIDDVRVYNYPLSSNQVKIILNEGAGVRYGD